MTGREKTNLKDCLPGVGLVAKILVLATVYAVSGRIALLLAVPPGVASGAFPPAGIAMAALLICGNRVWPGILLGAIAVGASFDSTVSSIVSDVLCIGVGSTLQALLGAWLIRHFVGFPTFLENARTIGKFLLLAGPVACLTAATWSITALWLRGTITYDIGYNWFTWWMGDTIGVLVFLPLLLILFGEPREFWRRRRLSVAVPLVCVLIAAMGVFYFAEAQWQTRLQLELERRIEVQQSKVIEKVESYLEVVHAITMLYQSSDVVQRGEFRVFVDRGLSRHPGILALGWVPRVQASERRDFEKRARDDALLESDPQLRQGLEEFAFKKWSPDNQWRAYAPDEGTEFSPVYYIEPYQGNESALGIDLASNPARRVGLFAARDAGQPSATAPITLAQEKGKAVSFLLVAPIYEMGKPYDSIAERRANLVGYATGAFRMQDIVEAALSESDRADTELRVFDDSVAEGELNVLYGVTDEDRDARWSQQQLRLRRNIDRPVGDRTWRLEFTPRVEFVAGRYDYKAWSVPAAMCMLALMVCGALLLVTGRSDAAIRDSEQRFRSIFEMAAVGMAQVATDGRFLRTNQKLCDILGYSSDEVRTMSFRDITHPSDLELSNRKIRETLENSSASFSIEKRYRRKDGSTVWANVSIALVRGESKESDYFIAAIEDISQRRQAEIQLEEEQVILRRLIELQESERRLVAHDIHDGFAQDLVGAQMQLQGVLGDPDSNADSDDLQRIIGLLNKAIKECRRLIRDLRPMILDESGVVDAIAHLVAEENENYGLTVAFAHDVQFDRLDPKLEGAIYRIVQESISNVRRHAKIEHAAVELAEHDGMLSVVVRDQGVGFDPEQVATTCFGLRGVRERARLFNGTAEINSTPGEGTTVSVRLPVEEQ